MFLKISQNLRKKKLCRGFFFNKVLDWKPNILSKRDQAQIFDNAYFGEHLPTVASVHRHLKNWKNVDEENASWSLFYSVRERINVVNHNYLLLIALLKVKLYSMLNENYDLQARHQKCEMASIF